MSYDYLYAGRYLKSADLDLRSPTDTLPVTIKSTAVEEVGQDREERLVVTFEKRFHGKVKPLILNASNYKTLRTAFGADVKAWIDEIVELYIVPTFFNGEHREGIRLRVPTQAQRAAAQQAQRPPKVQRASEPPAPATAPDEPDLNDDIVDIG
jgi:hypothetical protein